MLILLLLLSPSLQADQASYYTGPAPFYTASYAGCRTTGSSHSAITYGKACQTDATSLAEPVPPSQKAAGTKTTEVPRDAAATTEEKDERLSLALLLLLENLSVLAMRLLLQFLLRRDGIVGGPGLADLSPRPRGLTRRQVAEKTTRWRNRLP
jgi:hypothetical protein